MRAPRWGLSDLVEDALVGKTGQQIWDAFRECWRERRLLKSGVRQLKEECDPHNVRLLKMDVNTVFESANSLDDIVRVLVEADLAVFDVTGFEPGIMLLIGVRSAVRRGISLCSHGAGWIEGQPLGIPFNLHDLSFGSHTESAFGFGINPVVERFVERVLMGFKQFTQQPQYLDLPAYDALRQLGPQYEASSTINLDRLVFVLCSYADQYRKNWDFVRPKLEESLSRLNLKPDIRRLLDLGNPQLVSQALYERIRRASACLVDWTDFSPSTFLELGVRLAVSTRGAIQIIDEECLPGRPRAAKLGGTGGKRPRELRQLKSLLERFDPVQYRVKGDPEPFDEIARRLAARRAVQQEEYWYSRIHNVVLRALDVVAPESYPIEKELIETADSLKHTEQPREGAPQVLFYGSQLVKRDAERAALERRIAAWLYMEYRLSPRVLDDDDPLKVMYREAGILTVAELYERGEESDLALAEMIEERLGL